jgi:hypothetical protein
MTRMQSPNIPRTGNYLSSYLRLVILHINDICCLHRLDPNFLGPPPEFESFPPYTEKRRRRPKSSTKLSKKDYFVLREAEPHDFWYCEYPNCGKYLVPYVVWGARHHCRSCGLTVCADHCTRNITLSSSILVAARDDASGSAATPVLATSLDPAQLPPVVTLKCACMLCCDKALPKTFNRVQRDADVTSSVTATYVSAGKTPVIMTPAADAPYRFCIFL